MLGSQTSTVIRLCARVVGDDDDRRDAHASHLANESDKGKRTGIFSWFWGLMIGAIAPFIVTTFLDGGAPAVFEIFSKQPHEAAVKRLFQPTQKAARLYSYVRMHVPRGLM
jgi:hypothetical protein